MSFQFGGTSSAAAGGGFSFGTPAATPPTSFGFAPAAVTSAAPASGVTGAFTFSGAPAPAPASASSGFSFGSPAAGAPGASGFSFGAAPAPAASGGFSFASPSSAPSTAPAAGTFGFGAPSATSGIALKDGEVDAKTREGIQNAQRKLFNLYSAVCRPETSRFKHVFYNVVAPEVARSYQGPPASFGLPKQLLDRNNPDPERMVPVIVDGFDKLKERHEAQLRTRDMLMEQAAALAKIVREVKEETDRQRAELQQALHDNKQRRRRVLYAMCKLDLARSGGMRPTTRENAFVRELAALQAEIDSPTMFRARVTELASLERMKVGGPGTGPARFSKEETERVAKLLGMQQEGVKKLLEVLRADARDLQTIIDLEGLRA